MTERKNRKGAVVAIPKSAIYRKRVLIKLGVPTS